MPSVFSPVPVASASEVSFGFAIGWTSVRRTLETLNTRLKIAMASSSERMWRSISTCLELDHRLGLGSSPFDRFVGSGEFLVQMQDGLGDDLDGLPRPLGHNLKVTTGVRMRCSIFLTHGFKKELQVLVGHSPHSTPKGERGVGSAYGIRTPASSKRFLRRESKLHSTARQMCPECARSPTELRVGARSFGAGSAERREGRTKVTRTSAPRTAFESASTTRTAADAKWHNDEDLAASCPHLRQGGTIEIREIDRT